MQKKRQSLQCEVLTLQRDNHGIGGGKTVYRQDSKRRRTINEQEVVRIAYLIELSFQKILTFRLVHELDARAPRWRDEEALGGQEDVGFANRGVLLNLGCPYRGRREDPAVLDGVALPPELPRAGCTFCERPAPARIAVEARVDLALAQAGALAEQRPEIRRLQLVDEALLGYIDRLAAAITASDLPPRDWLFTARPDWWLERRERVEAALTAFAGTGHRLALFCLGVESLSAHELARYNKGYTPRVALSALALVDTLAERHAAFAVEPSFGFVLWNPWTTLDDLAANVKRLRAVDFTRYRQGVLHSRLRLYPEIPLYWKARADGLLSEGAYRDGGLDWGYGDLDWRFADPAVGRVYRQMTASRLAGDDLDGLARLVLKEIHRS